MSPRTTIDPTGHYNNYSPAKVAEACGIVLYWVVNPDFLDMPLIGALKIQYEAPLRDWNEGIEGQYVDSDGVYHYPDQSPDYPLVRIIRNDETFYMYEHALFSIVSKDGRDYVSRID